MDWNYSPWITRRLDVLVICKSQAGVVIYIIHKFRGCDYPLR